VVVGLNYGGAGLAGPTTLEFYPSPRSVSNELR
jgi:hypothetical protein